MGQIIYQADAFTNTPFAGNPAAVCLLAEPAGERWMQDVASEMNLSETAFLVRREDDFDLRWFTPTVELALCGHGTLASAHVLWETGEARPDETIRFHTKSGPLSRGRRRLDRARLSGDARRPVRPAAHALGRAWRVRDVRRQEQV